MTFTNFLIATFIFLLALVIIGQAGRISDLLSKITKSQQERYEQASNNYGWLFMVVGFIGLGLITWSYFTQGHKYLPEAASQLGRDWDFLFYKVFSPPIVLVFFITHILLFYFAYKYRYKKDRKVQYFAHSNKLEIIWTSVPLITMIILGFLTIPKWVKATAAPGEDAMHIKVTGMQFKWFMAYAGEDGEFGDRSIRAFGEQANLLGLDPEDQRGYDDVYVDELVLPKGKEISFDLTALDVIHDFYLPHFRVKMDCVPGVPTRIKIVPDKTTEEMREITENPDFEYEIACAELCGTGHWNMRRTIRVVEPEEYDIWIKEQTTAKDLYYNTLLAELDKKKQAKEWEGQTQSLASSEIHDAHDDTNHMDDGAQSHNEEQHIEVPQTEAH